MTTMEIMDWAIERKFREDIPPPASRRIDPAIKEILRLLPYNYKPGWELIQVMDYEKDKAGMPCICFFFASNVSERARRQARRKDMTKKYQEILGVTGMPKWYTPFAAS
ncbi:hypothetical protein CPB85DRAFT_71202 [Mucidula mucida]|nr:hypothetical protein CPB85DRAFT_71202 [Mucidula mucida]